MKNRILIFILICPFVLTAQEEISNQTVDGNKILAAIDTTIWKYLAASDSLWTISSADSERAFKEYFMKGYNVYLKVDKIFQRIDNGRLKYEDAVPELSQLLPEVARSFEAGLRLNPFDKYLRQAIVPVYYKLFQLYAFKQDDIGRLQVMHNIICMQADRTTQIQLYNQMGRIYLKYQLWKQAKESFRLTVNAIFAGAETEIDSLQLFYNIYYRGQAYIKLYDADSALISIERARMIAPSPKEYQQLSDLIDYINWDQRNIYTSEQYYQSRLLVSNKEYEQAEKAYLNLLGIIQTERARDEAQLKLAIIQFNRLQKQEEAIARLWQVVKKLSDHHYPDSSAYVGEQEYWHTYGFMCIQLANAFFSDNRKLAFIYFSKATQIDCPDRGRAYLGLASLSLNNPEVCLGYCHNALNYEQQLAEQEKKDLYNLFYLSYSRKGEFAESRKWFQKFNSI